jgi:hypothetical protein
VGGAIGGICLLLSSGAGPAVAGSLADIGFLHGLTLHGPHAAAEVFFPLPNHASNVDLALDVYPSVALDPFSTVTIVVDDEPLATISLREGSRLVHVPIPLRMAQGDFLRVRLAADQALRRDEQCFDNDNPAVWTQIGPSSSLNATGDGDPGIGAVWRQLGGEVPIAMPTQPTLDDLQTALTLATSLAQRGAQPSIVGANDPRALLRIARTMPPLAVEWQPIKDAGLGAVPAVAQERQARLTVATPDAARVLVTAAATLRGAISSTASAEPTVAQSALLPGSVSLADIGIHPPKLAVFSTAETTLKIPFNRLAAGRHPVSLQLFGRGASPPLEEAVVVTVAAGGRLLWSQTFRGTVSLDGIQVDFPESVIRNNMEVTLRVVRVGTRRVCGADDGLEFDLRDSTRLILSDGYVPVPDFSAFAMPSDRPAVVRVDTDPATAAAAIPLVARLLADAGARPAAVDVVATGTAFESPFIVIAQTPPAEIAATANARPDLGRVVLRRPTDGTQIAIADSGRLTLVQLASAGAVPGLWVSPGARATLVNPAPLREGDLAVFDGISATPITFDTRLPGVFVEKPRGAMGDSLLVRWRTELFMVAWLAITVIAVFVVMRLRKQRR